MGVPAWRSSLSPTGAGETPAAVRDALRRYSPTLMGPPPVDLNAVLRVADAGDVEEPDGRAGEARVRAAVAALASARLLIALGGDNSATYAVAQGRGARGLITLDAHFDLRDGESNGSPVRRLLADGLDPRRVVQIGIADFATPPPTPDAPRTRASPSSRSTSVRRSVSMRSSPALSPDRRRRPDDDRLGSPDAPSSDGIHLDIDVDVCDRSVAPDAPPAFPVVWRRGNCGRSCAQSRATLA